jgi:hypothetical protein
LRKHSGNDEIDAAASAGNDGSLAGEQILPKNVAHDSTLSWKKFARYRPSHDLSARPL